MDINLFYGRFFSTQNVLTFNSKRPIYHRIDAFTNHKNSSQASVYRINCQEFIIKLINNKKMLATQSTHQIIIFLVSFELSNGISIQSSFSSEENATTKAIKNKFNEVGAADFH